MESKSAREIKNPVEIAANSGSYSHFGQALIFFNDSSDIAVLLQIARVLRMHRFLVSGDLCIVPAHSGMTKNTVLKLLLIRQTSMNHQITLEFHEESISGLK